MFLLLWACTQAPVPAKESQPTLDSKGETAIIDDTDITACQPVFPSLSFTSPLPSTAFLPTANGYNAAVYAIDAKAVDVHYTDGSTAQVDQAGAMVAFWDHPMQNVSSTQRSEDRLWDLYPGIKIDGTAYWLNTVADNSHGYINGTGIIRRIQHINDLDIETLYFSPFQTGAEDDLVAIVTVRNTGSTAHDVDVYSLSNAHVDGEGDADVEQLSLDNARILESAAEGSILHSPLGASDAWAAAPGGTSQNPWNLLSNNENFSNQLQSGADVAVGFQWHMGALAPGQEARRGWVMSWGTDATALSTRVNNWLSNQSADDILAAEQQNWDEWHALESPPPYMQAAELALYRQSTAVLRMGQVRESGPAYGQILASLPPGIWNISWPRDQSYATLALAQSGHPTEAEAAVQFILNGNAGNYAPYLGLTDYLVSVARYYGDGTEESDGAGCPDGSDAGPNIELDDFGLFLQAWAATPALAAASTPSVQTGVADPLIQLIQSNHLLLADSSIWERHWNDCFPNGRKQFVWSSIQAAAGLAQLPGQNDQDAAARLRTGLQQTAAQGGPVTLDANGQCPLLASAPEEICDGCGPLDASGVEAINLGLIPPNSALALGSLAAWMGLQNPSGGFRRNDDGTGSSNPYPWYDDQEWLFIDMRMALAMAAVGSATANPELQASADALIQHVTDIGTVNAGLLPELLSDGHYTPEDDADHFGLGSDPGQQAQGAHPMVGFGAGAYVLAMEILRR